LLAPPLAGLIEDDAKKPSPEGCLLPKAGQRLPRLNEGFHDHIFRIGAADQTFGKPIRLCPIAAHQRLKSHFVATFRPSHQFPFVHRLGASNRLDATCLQNRNGALTAQLATVNARCCK
jgi:hypothetical protein